MARLALLAILLVTCLAGWHGVRGFRIGAFNAQTFGETKAGETEVMHTFAQIIQRYDIILLQEIRDASQVVIYQLLQQTNALGPVTYGLQLSERLGRTSHKEQYAFFYRNNGDISVVDHYQYPECLDEFARPPFSIKVHSQSTAIQDFVLAGIRTDPPNALQEMDNLVNVHQDLSTRWNTENILLMGDFNADCGYASGTGLSGLLLRTEQQFVWLIGDEADTTTRSSNCAYDRLVVTGQDFVSNVVEGSNQVYRFDQHLGLTQEQTDEVSDHYPVELELTLSNAFRIASFNVQVFGQRKADIPEVMSVLTQIIQRYDIILIQEIRDSEETAIHELIEQTNSLGPNEYTAAISERLGRSISKEQYAFLYRVNSGIRVIDTYQYPDVDDHFEREPFAVYFHVENTAIHDFAIAGVHVAPNDAFVEINQLVNVHTALQARWNTDNILIMGDFNADCRYLSTRRRNRLTFRAESYTWLIGDEADTTTKTTDCAYDRFVMTGELFLSSVVEDSPEVYRYDTALGLDETLTIAVSDHYPIELSISAHN